MPSLTYTTNIPNPPNSPSVDVPNMQVNTNSINTIWTADHFTFSDANPGLHKQVQINTAGGIPSGLQNGFETLYAKVVAGNGELFFTRGSSGIEIQMTGPGAPSSGTNGYTFLPGGLLIQWGTVSQSFSSGSTTGTVTFATANRSFPNNCFTVTGNPLVSFSSLPSSQASVNIRQSTISSTSFQWQFFTNSNQYIGFFWVAIGN